MTDDEHARQLERLRDAPRRIVAATTEASDERLNVRTADEPWSVNDVLAHVRSAADVRDRFIRRLATEPRSSIPYQSARSELAKTDYLERPFAENLAAYAGKRAELVAFLESLPSDSWNRGARMRDGPRRSRATCATWPTTTRRTASRSRRCSAEPAIAGYACSDPRSRNTGIAFAKSSASVSGRSAERTSSSARA